MDEARTSAADAIRVWPTLTVRGFYQSGGSNRVVVAQIARVREGLRLAGMRDHLDEDVHFGVPADDIPHTDYEEPTPKTAPGTLTIRTPDLVALVEQRKPLILDTTPWGPSVPSAIGPRAGMGGTISDQYQEPLGRKMLQLTGGNPDSRIVTMGWNAERYQGRNLALRLVAIGYTNVYWYRGGREAWEVAGLPETQVDTQDW
jgi:adenylate cyclase